MMKTMLTWLRTTLFYVGYSVTLVPHATLCVVIGWMLPLHTRYHLAVLWNRFAVWWLQVTCGVSYRITGAEHVPDQPFVLLSNHQSPWETIFLYYYFVPLCATLKRELLYIPFFGWALFMLDPIAIDRSKRATARQIVLREGKRRLANGISVLVFPEGTRVAVGQHKKYSRGGAELAITAGVKVLPLAHNAGQCWPARRYLKTPGIIDVIIGAPIATEGRDARELSEAVQAWVQQALAAPPGSGQA